METTYKLRAPIEWKGHRISELTIREPRVKDLTAVSRMNTKSEEEYSKALVTQLCSISPEEVEELSIKDFKAISEKITLFFADDPKAI